ncbi:MAG: hypothetical protein RL186_555, partial [Pseudomonadota bacterium]
MADKLTLSIDAMGGDHAPDAIVAGVELFAAANPAFKILLHGDSARLNPLLATAPAAQRMCEVRHAEEVVAMDAKPSQAMRKKGTSMWAAIAAVKSGEAQAAVSAGNTGALMAIAHLQL